MKIFSLFHSMFKKQKMILKNQIHHVLLLSFSFVFFLFVFCFFFHFFHFVIINWFWWFHSFDFFIFNWIHSFLIFKRRISNISIFFTSFHFFVKKIWFDEKKFCLCRDVRTKYFISFFDFVSAIIRVFWSKFLKIYQYNPIQ